MKKFHWILPVKKTVLVFISMIIYAFAFAQEPTYNGLDGTMRSNGKIYVVVAGCLVILLGLFLYVFLIDRKISKLEKEN